MRIVACKKEIPSCVSDLVCHLLFLATDEPIAETHSQHGTIPHALNTVFSQTDIYFFIIGSSDVLFIKASRVEVCASNNDPMADPLQVEQ